MTRSELDKEFCKLRDRIIENEFKTLNPEQRKAVLTTKGPLLLIAGPGSGKTTVIVNRVYNMIKFGTVYRNDMAPKGLTVEDLGLIREYLSHKQAGDESFINSRAVSLICHGGIKPRNILTLTYNKAAQVEMERRFKRLYGKEISDRVHFATLHSFCNKVVRDYERLKGKSLRRIEGSDEDINKKLLIKDIYFDINGTKINDDELDSLLNEIGYLKNKMLRSTDDSFFSSKKFSKVYKAYEEYKRKQLMIDFDDMLTYAYAILIRYPRILESYRNLYKYIQIDEGQDMSNIQFEILKLLSGPEGNVFVVADDDQSIYSFRGAEPQYILNMDKQFENLSILKLENNYRSSANIVELSSKFISQNGFRYRKTHATQNGAECDPIIIYPENEIKQQEVVLQKIKGVINEKHKSIAVLYRNNLSSILVADKLQRNGIPFRIKQNRLFFFKHWLVQEVTAFLLFALDQHDTGAFSRICFRMNRFISKSMLECAENGPEKDPVIDRIMNNHDLMPFQINALRELKAEFSSLAKKRPREALEYITNKFRYLESIKEYSNIAGQSFDYLKRLYGILQAISLDCPSITSFLIRLQELEHLLEHGKSEVNSTENIVISSNEVTLSTLHSSKGLEYDCVLMIDLMNSEIPGDEALEAGITLREEERRLFYVGMTRAKTELYLICPLSINGENVLRSIFLNEVVHILQKDIINNVAEGKIVHHVKFGKGVVVAINESPASEGHTIEIKFIDGGQKKLDFQLCLKNKLLTFE